MIGDILLQEPKNAKEYKACMEVLKLFGVSLTGHTEHIYATALNLVRLNNEVYWKLNPLCKDAQKENGKCLGYCCGVDDDEPCDSCKECIEFTLYEKD